MYAPISMESGRQNSGVTGSLLIPMRFVWPYGGRAVFFTGSFVGWSELLPMSPVEGCPTVFQAICSLIPGYHEYKFLVDGEWHHDDNQPLVNGAYGMVNRAYLTREPGIVPAIMNSDIASESNMDVDNEAFRRLVRVSGMHELVPMISEGDLAASRQRISLFLSGHTVYELLPDSGKVVALDVSLPVKQAFHILYEQGISVAPLWDFKSAQFVGVLSSLDFILILRELGSHGSNLMEEELETHTISAWKDGKAYLTRRWRRPQHQQRLIHVRPADSLEDVTLKILENEVATVPVINYYAEEEDDDNQKLLYPQLLHLASLSGVVKCICRYFRHSAACVPVLNLPIYAVPVGTWIPKIGEEQQQHRRPLAMLRPAAPLSAALNLFVQERVSSIPIVDENDSLLDLYSRNDITALAKDQAYADINLDDMTVHQALQLVQDSSSSFELQRCQMCVRSDPVFKVMERLANPAVRRVVVVEPGSKRVQGIISLTDVFRLLIRPAP